MNDLDHVKRELWVIEGFYKGEWEPMVGEAYISEENAKHYAKMTINLDYNKMRIKKYIPEENK